MPIKKMLHKYLLLLREPQLVICRYTSTLVFFASLQNYKKQYGRRIAAACIYLYYGLWFLDFKPQHCCKGFFQAIQFVHIVNINSWNRSWKSFKSLFNTPSIFLLFDNKKTVCVWWKCWIFDTRNKLVFFDLIRII